MIDESEWTAYLAYCERTAEPGSLQEWRQLKVKPDLRRALEDWNKLVAERGVTLEQVNAALRRAIGRE